MSNEELGEPYESICKQQKLGAFDTINCKENMAKIKQNVNKIISNLDEKMKTEWIKNLIVESDVEINDDTLVMEILSNRIFKPISPQKEVRNQRKEKPRNTTV